jgi:hypothetical protein
MAKWALLSAHRYLEMQAARPRRGDGVAWSYPWRRRSVTAITLAANLRAARPQPRWPRLVGVLCLGLAALAAATPGLSMPTHVPGSSTHRGGGLLGLHADFPSGPLPGLPHTFRWTAPAGATAATVVVLGSDYTELLRLDGIAGTAAPVPTRVWEELHRHPVVHWKVEVELPDGTLVTPLRTFGIR